MTNCTLLFLGLTLEPRNPCCWRILLFIISNTMIIPWSHRIYVSLQRVDTTRLGLSPSDAAETPYIASMGIYVFKTEILLDLLRWRYPTSNDFGSEIIPAAVKEHDVQVSNSISDYGFSSGLRLAFRGVKACCSEQTIYSTSTIYLYKHWTPVIWLNFWYYQGYIFRDYWEDIGTVRSFYEANLALTEEVRVVVSFLEFDSSFWSSSQKH